jgi:Protein of unknown function (DUF4239)
VIWLQQLPAPLVAFLVVGITVGLAVLGLVLSRRIVQPKRLEGTGAGASNIFNLAGWLYTVLLAFVFIVVWQQFDQAQKSTESEAVAISDLLRDSEGLPAAVRPAIRQSLIAYTKDVVDDEFPRMRRGEAVEQESEHLTQIWQSFLQLEPVSQREISFYRESITRIDDLDNARKTRIASSQSEIPNEMWVLLLGGGMVMLLFTYLFATMDLVLHGVFIALAGALMAFVLYLIFAMEHPFVGSIAVGPDPFTHVLDTWSQLAPK